VRSSRPGAPGHAPLVDFCNRNDLQARPSDLETRLAPADPREQIRLLTRCCSACAELLIMRDGPRSDWAIAAFTTTIQSKGSRGFTGQGPFVCIAIGDCIAGLLLGDRSLGRLRPNPIDSNTSCRATRVDYDRSTVIESSGSPASRADTRSTGSPPDTRFRGRFRGGPPPAPLREKEMRSAAPEVLSIPGLPLAGSALSPQFVPNLWRWWARAFSISAPFLRTDGALGATWTRPLSGE
jgi:hypothetical protein